MLCKEQVFPALEIAYAIAYVFRLSWSHRFELWPDPRGREALEPLPGPLRCST